MFWQHVALSSEVELEEAPSDLELSLSPLAAERRGRLSVAGKAAAALLAAAALAAVSVGLASVGGHEKQSSQRNLISKALAPNPVPITAPAAAALDAPICAGTSARAHTVAMPSVRTFDINLDTEPAHRWDEAVAAMRGRVRNALQQVATTYNLGLVPKAAAAGVNLDDVLQNVTANMAKLFRNSADQAEEMEGLAVALGVPLLDVMRFNVFYELSGACTSMLANDYKHKDIVHGRNLDYGIAGLSDIVVNARFKKGAEVVFECTTFLGYVGCLTGMAPGRFSISLNQRDEKDEVGNIIGYKEWNNFMLAWQQGAQGYGFWIRQSLSQRLSWRDMVAAASSTLFTRAAYLAIGGTKLDEAVILERRTHAVQLARWMKASLRSEFPELAKVSYANDFDGKPFVFVCNSDMKHADEARDETAWKLLNALAPRGYGVKSVKGVMDFEGNSTLHQGLTVETTTFTSEMVAARGIYNTQAKCAVPQYSNIGSGLAPAR